MKGQLYCWCTKISFLDHAIDEHQTQIGCPTLRVIADLIVASLSVNTCKSLLVAIVVVGLGDVD